MKNYLFILLTLVSISFSSCSKDENGETKATISLKNADGSAAASGITVYAYNSSTWEGFGDNEFFANKKIASDSEGKCEFLLDDITGLFAFDSQETIYFSAHYTLNGTEKTKYTSITFKKYDEKSGTITLD